MTETAKQRLLQLLVEHAYAYDPEGFTLSSGKVSNEYLNCKRALSHGNALPAVGAMVRKALDHEVQIVGGLTMGADPLAIAAAYAPDSQARELRWFAVRKDAKGHGAKRLIEGDIHPGDIACVLDDVVTSGQSTVEAIEKCRDAGLDVRQVIALVDREEGGLDNVREALGSDNVCALFRKEEIAEEWHRRHSADASRAG